MDRFATASNFFNAAEALENGEEVSPLYLDRNASLEEEEEKSPFEKSASEVKISGARSSLMRSGTDTTDFAMIFAEEGEDTDMFFDFTEALHNPDCLITF